MATPASWLGQCFIALPSNAPLDLLINLYLWFIWYASISSWNKFNFTLENRVTSNWSYFPSQMAISAAPFLVANGWLPGKWAYFFILSAVFNHLLDGWGGQPIATFLTIQFLPSGFLLNPLMAQIKGLPIDAPFKLFAINNFPWRTDFLTSQLVGFSMSYNSFNFRKASTSGGRKLSRQLPGASHPKRWIRAGRSLPVRGMVSAQLIRPLRSPCLAGHRSSNTLVSHPPLLQKGDRSWEFQYYIPIYLNISI